MCATNTKGKCILLILTILYIITSFAANGQKKKLKFEQSNRHELHDTVEIINKAERNFLITPYAAPSYSPELDVLFTIGGLMSFKLQPDNLYLERSSIAFSAGYSLNGSATVTVLPYIYGKDNKYKIQTYFYYKDMPDNYWGVGYENGTKTSSPNSATGYNKEWWSISGQVVFKIKNSFFLGPVYDFNGTTAEDMSDEMLADPYVVEYGGRIRNLGLGIVFELDRRDNAQNAYSGHLFSLAFTNYNGLIVSNKNNFNKITLDMRKYFSLDKRRTIALQFNTKHTEGKVPWTDMPQIGTPNDLRGYQWGRFRDRTTTFFLAEYRHMFARKRINKRGNYESRFGFVGWAGMGSVAQNYSEWDGWLPNAGIGFRAEIQPRMNLRIDYGFGKDSNALYLTFSEAF